MSQQNNPLHGLKLEAILTFLVDKYGWEELGLRINIRCFTHDPSIKSSLAFLRKTQWARDKVEYLYLKANKLPLPAPKIDSGTSKFEDKPRKMPRSSEAQMVKTKAQPKTSTNQTDDLPQVNKAIWGNAAPKGD
ncbi:VF530 family DNA-binding protein [Shewanella sp. SR44-3]|uniref:VF530 family protein n=1 Tax=unclassified Shewanella TaxID=196818 RepID=UPI0015FBC463|nr:VF530 family protein [Shewanella sp. SR44-3]MBB1269921.1 DUF2132 domain-containing protein [Shewanella sp. SR44-3]